MSRKPMTRRYAMAVAVAATCLSACETTTCPVGTATAGDVLSGKTFSIAGLVVTGTMPNNGAVALTPSTIDQTIAAGYHNGSGKCVGDADLLSGNIRSGVHLFGVNGDSNVVDTSGATASASNIVSGETCYANGGLVTGGAVVGANVNGPNGSRTFTIPDGLYSGSETATANDSNLAGGNIVTGVSIFGVAGTALPSQTSSPLKTGQTTVYGTGSDGDLQKGVARQYTDNGDGTVTDDKTGLMWEKKDQSGGIHDWSNRYTWSGASYGDTSVMDGTITRFLAGLNAGGGFAGYTDWRIPNRFELESISNLQNVNPAVDTAFNTSCAANCTVTGCSCTQSLGYWSSTTYQTTPYYAWYEYFNDGFVGAGNKSSSIYVRAVRGGS